MTERGNAVSYGMTCRQRKLKCDEVKPTCGQCRKASRECHPSDGVVFRHQQNASMNGDGEVKGSGEGNGKLGGFYAYKNTFNEENVWVDVPKTVTFLHITDPFNMEPTPEPEDHDAATNSAVSSQLEQGHDVDYFPMPFDQAPGLEALSTAATSNFQYIRPMSVSEQSPGEANISSHSPNNINFILNPAGADRALSELSPAIDPALTSSPHQNLSKEDPKPIEDHEVAFLLRHFSETAGQWMDLFDLGCYFAHEVPVQAISNALIRYSACAYAAKQLGRVRGRKAIMGGIISRQAEMELYPHSETVDWAYVGAKYYDKAILLLMEQLSNAGNQEVPITPMSDEIFSPQGSSQSPHPVLASQENSTRRHSRPSHANHADETFAAGAILCVYEFLDNANVAWVRHLTGTKSLFDLAENERMMPVQLPTSPDGMIKRMKPSKARKATFWNFARQDFLAAFINEGQTRLNTEDFGLWRAAGLLLDEQGFVIPSNTEDFQYPDRQTVMREDMISNALIWLMSKIINYMAAGDSVDNVYPQDRGSSVGLIGINQMILLERWMELEKELDVWYRGLPDAFKPCARQPPPVPSGGNGLDSGRIFSEIWYSLPMCASTMQSYHMARIILLVNKPHESTARQSTLSNRLHSYRAIEAEVRYHCYEICGIALGRPEASVRVHQIQALFVAGQCLTGAGERRVIRDLLRGIENDLGWATDYRVQQLLKEWGWSAQPS